jgi:hypothetical protein
MSRFGWAYVNDIVTGSGGTPGGLDKQIQFNSGSTFSGSTNLTFDYTSNTLRLTGTLYADSLIVSSSVIYKSGSTKFGDDLADTHQFTGSIFTNNNLTVTGQVSASTALNTAGTIQAASNITSTGGTISSSVALNTAGTLGVGQSATIGTGLTVLANGFRVTGSSFVTGVLSASFIQAGGFQGNGSQLTDINGSNVYGVGDDWTIQLKDGNTGTLTGSSNLTFSGSTLTLTGTFVVTGNVNVTSILTTATASVGSLSVSGPSSLGTVYERLLLTSSIPTTVTFDTSNQSTLYINNPAANFTINFTNVFTTDSRVSTYNVIISQSATPYSASSVQVNTTSSIVKWVNSTVPTGNANKHDVYGFSLIRSGSTWVTLGQLSTYG